VAGSLAIAEDAAVAAWWERPAGGVERWRVVRNGKPVDDVTCGGYWPSHPPVLSPDGEHVLYVCPEMTGPSEGGVRVVHDGGFLGTYDDVWGPELSADGEHVAYGAARGGGDQPWRLYRDGEAVSGPQWSVWRPRFTPDSETLAWEMQSERAVRGRTGVERIRLASFDDILRGPEFRDDVVWWVIRRGKRVVRVEYSLD
jgi:hypothetical protein